MQVISNTSNSPYLVIFKNTSTKYFILPEHLGAFLSQNKNLMLKDIKIFNSSKDTFKRLPKTDLKRFNSWNTETIQELKFRNYI